MSNWECQKAAFLILQAAELGMQVDGYGEVNVNPNSGYTYLWLDDYSFCLYMEINCDLEKRDVYVLWTNPEDGEETEARLTNFKHLKDIYEGVDELENESNELS